VPSIERSVLFGDPRLPPRFWEKVYPIEDGCWIWAGSSNRPGYGEFWIDGRIMRTHRLSYLALVGPITEETIDHLCNRSSCVNPSHLENVSQRTNILRSGGVTAANFRRSACKHGHPFNERNTYIIPGGLHAGTRHCMACEYKKRGMDISKRIPQRVHQRPPPPPAPKERA